MSKKPLLPSRRDKAIRIMGKIVMRERAIKKAYGFAQGRTGFIFDLPDKPRYKDALVLGMLRHGLAPYATALMRLELAWSKLDAEMRGLRWR